MTILIPLEQAFDLPPAGVHPAVCYRIIDLGTQPTQYGPKRRIMFSWELLDENNSATGNPLTISRSYNLSSERKSALRADIEGWLGRVLTKTDFGRFDLGSLLGMACTLVVKHEQKSDGRVYANVVSIMQPAK